MAYLYEKVSQVGEGTYGYSCLSDRLVILSRCRKVYKARTTDGTGRLVAMKKIRMETEKEGV